MWLINLSRLRCESWAWCRRASWTLQSLCIFSGRVVLLNLPGGRGHQTALKRCWPQIPWRWLSWWGCWRIFGWDSAASQEGKNGTPAQPNANQSFTSICSDVLFQVLLSKSFVMLFPVQKNKEDNALKAKLRRLCEPKKNGKLQIPAWLHEEWKTGDHLTLARQYQACNFDKAIHGLNIRFAKQLHP